MYVQVLQEAELLAQGVLPHAVLGLGCARSVGVSCVPRPAPSCSFLQESARQSKPVIFVTSCHPHRKGNAAILLGAWLILFEGYTGEAAYSAIQRAEPFAPFRDASCGHSQFGLTVKHVLAVRILPHSVYDSQQHQAHSHTDIQSAHLLCRQFSQNVSCLL